MNMSPHHHVHHPREILREARQARKRQNGLLYANDMLLEWITDHVLASVALFDLALILPLLVIPGPETLKITLGVISGSWIQLWALPALQRSQNKTQAQNDAKAEADHETLTYLANTQDEQLQLLNKIAQQLSHLKTK